MARIFNDVQLSGVCSMINKMEQDLSKMETSRLLIQYTEGVDCTRPRPFERLAGVFTRGRTSGQTLCDRVVEHLTAIYLSLALIIGQNYDGTGNIWLESTDVCKD